MPPTSQLQIDLGALDRNLGVVREALSRSGDAGASVCAVLKADGYGLGATALAKRLAAGGVAMLAVFTPEQARALVNAAIRTPILLLMPVRSVAREDRLFYAASQGLLHFSVHDPDQLQGMIRLAETLGLELPLHLEIDTGMSRGGVPIDGRGDAGVLLARINEHPRLRLAGVYTHHASADRDPDLMHEQHGRFDAFLERAGGSIPLSCAVHEANSFALWRDHATHRRMARVGLSLLGYAREEMEGDIDPELGALADRLEPVVRWTSHVSQTKRIAEGATVGYGATWRAERPTRLAVVPVGYADGYPLALSNRAAVGVRSPGGDRWWAPVVGRVSMDQITVDVTDLPEEPVRVGTEIEIVSPDRDAPNHLPALARLAGTITHELLCRLHPSIERRYLTPSSRGEAAGARGAGVNRPA